MVCAARGLVAMSDELACESSPDLAERSLCLGLLQCELRSGCAGTLVSASCGDGACRQLIELGLGSTDDNFIGNHLLEGSLPASKAHILGACLQMHECSECFPSNNVCPTIDGVSVDPASAAVGDTISLTSSVSDPDHGPSELTYDWASRGDAGELGMLSDLHSQNPSFMCADVGSTDLSLTVSDGECVRSAFVTVRCGQ